MSLRRGYSTVPTAGAGNIEGEVDGEERELAPRNEAGVNNFGMDAGYTISMKSWWLPYWNFAAVFFIFLDMIFIPLEIAFDQVEEASPTLRVIIDVFFFLDTFLPFFLQTLSEDGTTVIEDLGEIARLRLKGPFLVDLASIVPLEHAVIRLVSTVPVYELRAHQNWAVLERLYFCKLTRVVQLLRVTRLSRVLGEWRLGLGLTYNGGVVTITSVVVVCVVHFAACIWASLCRPNFEYTWLDAFHTTHSGGGVWGFVPHPSPGKVYLLSLYWSLFTVTSVGYGDIFPQAQAEYVGVNIGMLLGGTIWAAVVANIVTVVTSLDDVHEETQKQLDKSRTVCTARALDLPEGSDNRVAEYYHQLDTKRMYERHLVVLEDLSPTLLIQVTQRTYAFIIQNCFLMRFQPAAVANLALRFKFLLHAPTELTAYGRIFCACLRGIGFYRSRIIQRGQSWGESFLIANSDIRPSTQALAMSYLTLATLNVPDCESVMAEFPLQQSLVRRLHVKQTFICGLLAFAEYLRELEGIDSPPSSPGSGFTGKLQAAARRKSQEMIGQDNFKATLKRILAGQYVRPLTELDVAKDIKKRFGKLQDRKSNFEESLGRSSASILEKLERLQQTVADRVTLS
jgi:hypothetical protein